ncbi:phenylacetate--CoA ligase family protein [Marinobacter szutsaonensis]
MNNLLSRYLLFYPSTILKGEPVPFFMRSYLDRQWISRSELAGYQFTKIKNILNYAYSNSAFYKKKYDGAGFDIHSFESLDDLKNIPTINKRDLIENIEDISVKRHSFFSSSKTTGGSTGEPVKLYKNPFALARERCATARSYEWAGIKIGDPQLRFWGIPHSQSGSTKSHIIDLIANRKRISAFNITDISLKEYYEFAVSFKPVYIYGYVSVILVMADYMEKNQLPPLPSVAAVITTSEILSMSSRLKIYRAFNVPVFNEYGCGEVGSIAHECESGSMHLMADNLFVEVEAGSNESGELIVTDFFNKASPLIRYRVGDYGRISGKQCPCGRSLPLIENIHGRAYDIITLPTGRKVHPEAIIYIFEDIQSNVKTFNQFQVVQESLEEITINIIPNNRWGDASRENLLKALAKNLSSNIKYSINLVSEIPREKSGKMRLVKSKI